MKNSANKKAFGDIPGYPEGTRFGSRAELFNAGVHREKQAGISGNKEDGAYSVVLSGGYEDDRDFGNTVIYTGQGGRDLNTGRQVRNQLLTRGNLALAKSCMQGSPVRMLRGGRSSSSEGANYTYDGLYKVEDYWREKGQSGYWIWCFRLVKIDTSVSDSTPIVREEKALYQVAPRRPVNILRIIRDTEQAQQIKKMYRHACQVCGIQLMGSAGPYAEAAHIRPLGQPHNGSDTLDNLLCLCPNHHVLFDYGGFSINDDLTLLGLEGRLYVHAKHTLCCDYLRYHREHYFPHAEGDEDEGDQELVAEDA